MINTIVYVKSWFLQKVENEKHVQISSFAGSVLKETEKAVFLRFDEAYNYRTGADYVETWVPKSCLYSEAETARFNANVEKAAALFSKMK